jgi:hypothetical protein
MAADMDIEMDLDVGLMDEDVGVTEIETVPKVDTPLTTTLTQKADSHK